MGDQSVGSFSGAEKLDELSPKQTREVEKQGRANAALIHETIRAEGLTELERSVVALALSALAAGMSMGFSLLVQGWLHAALPPGPTQQLLSPLGYTVGFLVVVLGRQQLFTENTLTPVLPLLHDRSVTNLVRLLRLWLVVLLGNVIGTIVMAFAIAKCGIFEPAAMSAFTEIARPTVEGDFVSTFYRAIFAGWLIALMVWLLPGAESARFVVSLRSPMSWRSDTSLTSSRDRWMRRSSWPWEAPAGLTMQGGSSSPRCWATRWAASCWWRC